MYMWMYTMLHTAQNVNIQSNIYTGLARKPAGIAYWYFHLIPLEIRNAADDITAYSSSNR